MILGLALLIIRSNRSKKTVELLNVGSSLGLNQQIPKMYGLGLRPEPTEVLSSV